MKTKIKTYLGPRYGSLSLKLQKGDEILGVSESISGKISVTVLASPFPKGETVLRELIFVDKGVEVEYRTSRYVGHVTFRDKQSVFAFEVLPEKEV